jgi:HK97 family phage major capsid protein
MENVYLAALRERYESLRQSIAGVQQQASGANRQMTPEELRSVTEMGSQADAMFREIEMLSEIEIRNASVNAMAGRVTTALAGGGSGGNGAGSVPGQGGGAGTMTMVRPGTTPANDQGVSQTRAANLGGAHTQARDPGFYTRGSGFSFLGDQFRSMNLGDRDALQRLLDHSNALRDDEHLRDVLGAGASTGGLGLVPPVWLADQFAPILHRRLRVARFLRQVPWAGPFAWSIPVAGTPALTSSVAEGINTTETDPTYTVLTVTPQAMSGYSEVSRQMLEASNPAVDAVIWGDMIGNFYDNCETAVIVALNAQSGVNTVTVSAAALTTTDILLQRSGLLDGIAAISDNSAGDATIWAGRTSRWTTYLKMQDGNGRPLILAQQYNPQNAIGIGNVTQAFANPAQGQLESLDAVTSPTIAASTGFILNPEESLFSVSPPMQFTFEQPAGPALVRVGVWGYEAVTFGRRPKSITKITYSGS